MRKFRSKSAHRTWRRMTPMLCRSLCELTLIEPSTSNVKPPRLQPGAAQQAGVFRADGRVKERPGEDRAAGGAARGNRRGRCMKAEVFALPADELAIDAPPAEADSASVARSVVDPFAAEQDFRRRLAEHAGVGQRRARRALRNEHGHIVAADSPVEVLNGRPPADVVRPCNRPTSAARRRRRERQDRAARARLRDRTWSRHARTGLPAAAVGRRSGDAFVGQRHVADFGKPFESRGAWSRLATYAECVRPAWLRGALASVGRFAARADPSFHRPAEPPKGSGDSSRRQQAASPPEVGCHGSAGGSPRPADAAIRTQAGDAQQCSSNEAHVSGCCGP